ncbi:MAG: HTH-type transcriptional regulator IscR [Haliscomenobacter sp.]|nr:HTH-type transcriptional regulator IscR [Haliscomenobacter sp.]
MLYLAGHPQKEGYVGIKEISEQLDISFHFLTKILQTLTQEGLLRSLRGPAGGVTLNQKTKDINVLEVILLFEGKSFFDTCILGLPGCGERKPCPMHDFWKQTQSSLQEKFRTTTLAELSEKVLTEGLRLSPCD